MDSISSYFKSPVQQRLSSDSKDQTQTDLRHNVKLCDDIMIKILEFLPIRDKVETGPVFEQFDKCLTTVRLRQKVLSYRSTDDDLEEALVSDIYEYIDSSADEDHQKNWLDTAFALISNIRKYIMSGTEEDSHKQRLIKVFETFPNVKELNGFGYMTCEPKISGEWVLQSIIDYYPSLKSISGFDFCCVSNSTIREFAETIGPTLKNLEIQIQNSDGSVINEEWTHLLKRSASLKRLTLGWVDPDILFEVNDSDRKIVINNLSHLFILPDINCTDLSAIIDANPALRKLAVNIMSRPFCPDREYWSVIEQMSQLERLTDLKFVLYGLKTEYTQQLGNSFESLAINLRKLEHFYLKVKVILKLNTNDLLSRFEHFSNLQSLDIDLDIISENSQKLDFIWLKSCEKLTQLKLISKVSTFTDSISQIPIYSPKLQILWLFTKSQANITDKDLKCLAQLKHLTQLWFSSGSTDNITVTDEGIIGLIDGCPDLQFLKVNQKVSITSPELLIRRMAEKSH